MFQPLAVAVLTLLTLPVAMASTLSDFTDGFATAAAQGRSSYQVDIDNDSLLFDHRDKFYTSGVRLSARHALSSVEQQTTYGWRFGQDQFTASDIKIMPADLAANDHPYAGWLYAGVFKTTSTSDGRSSMAGLDLGCLGPCAGGAWSQKTLHRIIDQPQPQGWSTQVKNEPGLVLYGSLTPVRWQLASAVDLTPTVHGRFGNIVTDAGAGLVLRAGQLNRLPDQPTLHAFLRLDGRAVAYDASLQGGYFSNGNLHTVRPKRLTGEIEAGFQWQAAHYGFLTSFVRRGNTNGDLDSANGSQNFLRLQFVYAL
ncbi:MAG: lipid A deacylase LpxR family protein [Janthinobacterium lividum]